MAEWSKALASGASPQGRGFEPHSCHFLFSYLASSASLSNSRLAAHLAQLPSSSALGLLLDDVELGDRPASGYIAQWLERLTADQQVPGSNPGVPFSPWAQLQSSTSIPLLRQQGQEEGNQRPQGLCGRNMARALFVTMPLGKGSINLFSAFVAPPCLTRAVIAQLAARRSHNPKVVSSILTHRISPC